MEEQSTQDNISVGTEFRVQKEIVEEKQEDEWDLSGTINQCIQRYADRLTEDQLNEILLGLENGLTEEEVKSYFTFPVEKMNSIAGHISLCNDCGRSNRISPIIAPVISWGYN